MSGKKVAIFGLGDQNGYGFNFLDAVGTLADDMMEHGAQLWGLWNTTGYEFEDSKARAEEFFLGVGMDQEGQADATPKRVQAWVAQTLVDFGL